MLNIMLQKRNKVLLRVELSEIESKLSNAEIIDVRSLDVKDKVVFGSTIELENISSQCHCKI